MAVYRVDQYGRTYYGPNPDLPTFDEKAFEAYSVGYEGIYLDWGHPSGAYTGFALVASKEGYPRTIEDGRLLIQTGSSAPTFYIDNDVVPGRFHFYSIFLKIQNVWLRAGTSSTLHVKDYQMVPWLWFRIPVHHRLLQGSNLTVDADSNATMLRFISMIGYGLDRVRSSMQAALESSDLRNTHITTVQHRAKSLGTTLPEGLDAAQERILTIDGAYLAANRGHPDAMRAAGRATSGWDMDLRMTHNILPSYDMAEQLDPVFPTWDASIRYQIGTVVRTDLHLYRCIVASYGLDQAPPGNGSNNTWWVVHNEVNAATVAYDATLLTQHGWAGVSKTAGVADTLVVPKIGIGVPHPITGDLDANCLTVHNTHSAAVSISAYSLPANTANNPLIPLGKGIPLPRIKAWDRTVFYQAESLVEHKGQVWRALRQNIDKEPGNHASWTQNSTDKRLRLTLSGYTHQAHGTAQAVAPVTPYITWFDEFGKTIGTVTATSAADTRVLDTFTKIVNSGQVTATSEPFTLSTSGTCRVTGRFQQTGAWTLTVSVLWLNSAGALISTSNISPITPLVGSWSNPDDVVTAPAGVAKGIMQLMFTGASSTSSILYCDSTFVAKTVALSPPLNANSTFDTNVANWSVVGGTKVRNTTVSFSGGASMQLTPNSGDALAPLGGRNTEFGSKVWADVVPGFIRDSYDDGSARPLVSGTRCMSVITYTSADASIVATVATAPSGGLKQGLVLRVTDSSNYFRATRTALERVQVGTVTTLATYGTAAVDGDRITARVQGNIYTVFVNGNQVATATDAFNNTATKFGLVTES